MSVANPKHTYISCAATFFIVFIGLYVLYELAEPMMGHYFNWLAVSVSGVSAWFDSAVSAKDNLILYDDVAVLRVIEGCDGVTVFILIAAAILSFPKPFKQRLIGLLILIPMLFVINWLRLLVLAQIRFYQPDLFHFFHVYLFQPFMIFATFTCFIIWILRHDQPAH